MTITPQGPLPATVHLAFETSPEDLARFSLHNDRTSGRRAERWRFNAVRLAAVVASIPLIYFVVLGADAFRAALNSHMLPYMFGIPVAAVFSVPLGKELLAPRSIRQQIRTLYGRVPGDSVVGRRRLEANAAGLTVTGSKITTHYAWDAILSVEEAPTHLFLMTGSATAIIIPKQGQPQPALDVLRRMAAAHTGGRRSAG